jgi:signal transduction histidine kinase
MAHVFNKMAETLEQRYLEISEKNDQLDKLTRRVQIARESESMRIARDLHDEIGQVLTSIKMDLSRFQTSCVYHSTFPCSENVDAIKQKLDQLVVFIRGIASALRPPVLDKIGLVKAVELLSRNTERSSDLMINLEAQVVEPLDWLTSITVYRIVQESLTNIVRHAQASEANISLTMDDRQITLRVEDNGKGFDPAAMDSNSLGIIGMRERARLIGGSLSILQSTVAGTVVEAIIPVSREGCYAHPVG